MKSFLFLYWQWLRRDIVGRYRGTMLGLLWPLLQPMLQIAVFTTILYHFMQVRWPQAPLTKGAEVFGLNVFAGMIFFNFFAEVLNRSPVAVLSQPNLVTKVRFPLVILPLVTVGSALLGMLPALCLLLLACAVTVGLGAHALLLPLLLIPVLAYAVGLAIVLSGLGVYLRDIGQVMPPLVGLLMFLTPIFYPTSVIPEALHIWFGINPIAWSVEAARDLVINGNVPALWPSLIHTAGSLVSVVLGLLLFARISKGFDDVL